MLEETGEPNPPDSAPGRGQAETTAETTERRQAPSGVGQDASPHQAPDRGRTRPARAPFVPDELRECNRPKRWPEPPKRGDLVFWGGERFWVEVAPKSWDETHYVRIGDSRVAENQDFRTRPLPRDRTSFHVHADELAAVAKDHYKRAFAKLPTVASVARAERAKAGVRDVGDEIATLLRKCGDLPAVYNAASEYLGVPVEDLRAKYGHLNNGQQRMNLGNRMRAKFKKDH